MNENFYVMVGNQFLIDYQRIDSDKEFRQVDFDSNPESAIPYDNLKKAREHAIRLGYMFESTNARVVKKVVKTVYEDVDKQNHIVIDGAEASANNVYSRKDDE